MKVWNDEVNNCEKCKYTQWNEAISDNICSYTNNILKVSGTIDVTCPFNKPITKEVFEELGWKFIEHWIKYEEGDIYYNNLHGLTWFKKTRSISIWTIDTEEIQYNGKLDNPEHLKFILNSVI